MPPGEGFVLFSCFATILAAALLSFVLSIWGHLKRRERELRLLAARLQLEDVTIEHRDVFLSQLSSLVLRGRYQGRPCELSFAPAGSGGYRARLFMVVENPLASFGISKPDVARWARERPRGQAATSGQQRLDRKFALRGSSTGLRALFADPEAEQLVDRLLRVSPEGVQLDAERGGLVFEGADVGFSQSLGYLEWIFMPLAALAELCDRRPLTIKVLGEQPHLVWTGGTDQPRCPFCRDDFQTTDEDLAVCEYCDTVHHAECLEEAGGCTVLGCRGGQVRRERARQGA